MALLVLSPYRRIVPLTIASISVAAFATRGMASFTSELERQGRAIPLTAPSSCENNGETFAGCSEEKQDEVVQGWRTRIETSIAKSRKVRGGNYVQIATVDGEGSPRCRTVVFRGFQAMDPDGRVEALKMITDQRSEKVTHVAASSKCEMVWWFAKSSEQYRISGNLKLVSGEDANGYLVAARKQQWGNLSDTAREQFYWKSPGVAFGGTPQVPAGGRGEDGKVLSPPDAFLLMLLVPQAVKYLRLTDNWAQVDSIGREVKTGVAETEGVAELAWQATRVNP